MDFLRQFNRFLGQAGPMGLVFLAALVLALFVLAVLGKRNALLALYLVALMFSGFVVTVVDSGSTLFRWLVMILLGLTCLRGARSPGAGAICLGIFALMGLLAVPMSVFPFYSFQFGLLMAFMTLLCSSSIAFGLQRMADIYRFFKILLVAAGIYVVLGLYALPSLTEGARFAGAYKSAPLFVMTGGLLLPVALWGAMSDGLRRWRWYCRILTAIIAIMCVLSGQRAGTFAGFLACLPILTRFGVRKVALSVLAAGLAVGAVYGVLRTMPGQAEFVGERFRSSSLTGRQEIWQSGLSACLEDPFRPHGFGLGVETTDVHSFHNAFLAAWHSVGFLGLVLFSLAFVVMALQSVRMIVAFRTDPELPHLGRLLLGIVLACAFVGFFEEKTLSPSNFAIFMATFASVVLTRARAIAASPPQEDWVGETFPAEPLIGWAPARHYKARQ